MLGCISGQSLQLGCSRGFHEGARNSGSRATHRISIAAKHQPSRSLGPQVLSQRHPCTSGSIRRSTRRSVSAAAWFNQQSAEANIEQTAQLTQEDDTLEVLRLAPEVRERVTTAVEDLGGTVTVGDISARSGVSPFEAEQALQALAADAQGTLQVSSEGDVLYALPRGFRGAITARSWKLRAAPYFKKALSAANYIARISFGFALVTSVAVVWIAIFAILSSANSDRDDRRGSRGYGGPSFFAYPSDMFFFMDPYRNQRRRVYDRTVGSNMQAEEKMNFFEAIFSYVFGDGDPNIGWEEERWQTLGRLIAAKGGVVTAEEMALYLDLPKGGAQSDDEGYVVPALVKFGGHPEVDDCGNLLYTFPDLQKSGSASQSRGVVERPLYKAEWTQTLADGGQKVGAIALGIANLVGVTFLGSLLMDATVKAALADSSLGFVAGAMPLLQVYAAAFFAVPLVRWLQNKGRNADIEESNSSRRESAARLGAPRPQLASKLDSARQLGQASKKVITDRDITYRSDRDLSDQQHQQQASELDWEAQDFDKRLKYSSREKTHDKTLG